MNIFRLILLLIFLTSGILSGCAPAVYKYPPKSTTGVYDQYGRPVDVPPSDTGLPPTGSQQTSIDRTPFETPEIDPSAMPQKSPPSPPRIGSDTHSASVSPDNYLLAAVTSLKKESEQLLAQGRTDHAFATAERAIRMDPTNAGLWNLMARIQVERGNYLQAEQLSRKSNLLAKNDRRLQAENWRIIAWALREKGQTTEAEKALQKVRDLGKY